MRESIKYLVGKIKLIKTISNDPDFFIVILIILIGGASFGLGRLSKIEELKTPINIQYPKDNSVFVAGATENSQNGTYVASKNGSKYHLPWCSGAQRISKSNEIWFDSKAEAEQSGYTPAANCKGI